MFAPIALFILVVVGGIASVKHFIIEPRKFMKNPNRNLSGKTLLIARASEARRAEMKAEGKL